MKKEQNNLIENTETIATVHYKHNLENERNYGIDLLRIVAMFFIVIIHVIGHGKIDQDFGANMNGKIAIIELLKAIVDCAVNCYALITGFVYFSKKDKKIKLSKYIAIWLQVEFYSFLVTLLFFIFKLDTITIKQLVKSMLPVMTSQYWYFTAYTGVFFLIPWLNKIVQNIKNMKSFMVIVFCFSIFVTIANLLGEDPFFLENGLSFLWLAILYVIGACIKKYEMIDIVKKKNMLCIAVFLIIMAWGWKIGMGQLTMHFLGRKTATSTLMLNISPTMLGVSIILLCIFAKLNINLFWQRVIKFVSPATFGVYLMHDQNIIRKNMIYGKFEYISNLPIYLIPVKIIGIASIIFILGVIVDKMRSMIFKLLKVDKFSENIEKINH